MKATIVRSSRSHKRMYRLALVMLRGGLPPSKKNKVRVIAKLSESQDFKHPDVTGVLRARTIDGFTAADLFPKNWTVGSDADCGRAIRIPPGLEKTMIKGTETIGQIAKLKPASIEVFQSLGIRYCCHGEQELDSVSKTFGISASDLLGKINQAERRSFRNKGPWADPILEALIAHLVRSRESLTERELPTISVLASAVAGCGDQVQPNATEIAMVVQALTCEVESHLAMEKARLFPLIQNIELAYVGKDVETARPKSFRRSVGKMVHQHEEIGQLLSAAHRLTDGYDGSASVCEPYRKLCEKLERLDHELREEVHLENNILFNRALQFSDALWPTCGAATSRH